MATDITFVQGNSLVPMVEAARRYDAETQERRNYWGELAIWSTRRLGELIREGQILGEIDVCKGGDRKSRGHHGQCET